MKDEKIIDARNKSPKEIYDIYQNIAKDTMILRELREKIDDEKKVIEIYNQIKDKENLD